MENAISHMFSKYGGWRGDSPSPKCNRTACQTKLDRGFYRIWNLGTDEPRIYCPKCGRKIIEYNQHDEIKLKYEIVKEPA